MWNFIKIGFILSVFSQIFACSATDIAENVTEGLIGDDYCVDTYYCAANDSNLQTCCNYLDSNSCYYETGSQTFNCNGSDCSSAAQAASDYCLGTTSTKSEIDLATMLGLEKTKNIQLKQSIDEMYRDLGKELQE